jgi:hypothetical protein
MLQELSMFKECEMLENEALNEQYTKQLHNWTYGNQDYACDIFHKHHSTFLNSKMFEQYANIYKDWEHGKRVYNRNSETYITPNYDSSSKETRTFTFDVTDETKVTHEVLYTDIDEGYTNLKITPAENIEKIELILGGQRFERNALYNKLGKDATFIQMSDGNILPALERDKIEIVFYPKVQGKYTISYDVLKNTNTVYTNRIKKWQKFKQDETDDTIYDDESIIFSEQHCNETVNINDTNEVDVRMNFNHPMVMMYVFSDLFEEIENIRIMFGFMENHDTSLIPIKKNNYYCYCFGYKNSINFSRIDNAYLRITFKQKLTTNMKVDMYGISKNLIRIQNGMCGSAFSK